MARHASLKDIISDEQEANLRKLAAYLLTLPADYPDFEMSNFTQDGKGSAADAAHMACGTAACAVGHGPSAGLIPYADETWVEYSARVFIDYTASAVADSAWDWCFEGAWSDVDNTVHGAAKRIIWLLSNGLPDNDEEQRDGSDPLSYADMVPA